MSIEKIGAKKVQMSGAMPLKPERYAKCRAMITGLIAIQNRLRDPKGDWFEYETVGQPFHVEIEDEQGFTEVILSCHHSPLLDFLFGENWEATVDDHLTPSDY